MTERPLADEILAHNPEPAALGLSFLWGFVVGAEAVLASLA